MISEDQILNIIKRNNGISAKTIAIRLNAEKSYVDECLKRLRIAKKIYQDKAYKWYLMTNIPNIAKPKSSVDARLNNLCRYYLHCLSIENSGDIEACVNNASAGNYAELDRIDFTNIANSESVSKLVQNAFGHKAIFHLGYPTLLKQTIRGGNKSYKIIPLLLWQVELVAGQLIIANSLPRVNPGVIRAFSQVGADSLVYELIDLEKELGLDDSKADIEIDELIERLIEIRHTWVWVDKIDIEALNCTKPFSVLTETGIYNKAVLVLSTRSPYTIGLEAELNKLAQMSKDDYKDTALYSWIYYDANLNGQSDASNLPNEGKQIIEVLPMNTEQAQAVKTSMKESLTVVTGPPGTGKSQVVANLLINSAWWSKRVLFASKNNKAVDVVESRVNSLGKRPILLRVGANQYANRLHALVSALLSVNASIKEQADFNKIQTIYKQKRDNQRALDDQKNCIIEARNRLDSLEQGIEKYRKITTGLWDEEIFSNIPIFKKSIDEFASSLDMVQKSLQPFFKRILWMFIRKKREAAYSNAAIEINKSLVSLGIEALSECFEQTSLEHITYTIARINELLYALESVKEYNDALSEVKLGGTLEDFDRQIFDLKEELSGYALKLWQLWLITHAKPVSTADRMNLLDYLVTLNMMLDQGGQTTNTFISQISDLAKEYIPCWAVSSLSARGRVPFTPGYYDLLIIDEASQCDIASVLPLLYRAKRAVIIGDPQQLSHITNISSKQDQSLLHNYKLDHRYSYSKNSLYGFANALAKSQNIIPLCDHFRSHAEIISFSNKEFYNGNLRIATKYDSLNVPQNMRPGLHWIEISGICERPQGGSAVNKAEADEIIRQLSKLVIDDVYRGSIGIVTPFRAQAEYIRKRVSKNTELISILQSKNEFLVDTVHKFQGDERDIIFFSPVISEYLHDGALNFLRATGNLFNVAVTRARAILIVVGNIDYCMNCKVEYLENFARYSMEIKHSSISDKQEKRNHSVVDGFPVVHNSEIVSIWERTLFFALRDAGITAIPQFETDKYYLDFAVFDGDRKLNIEVDGEQYHRDWTGELTYLDQLRNHRLFELEWDVLRFWVYQIRDDMEWCVGKVKEWLLHSSDDN